MSAKQAKNANVFNVECLPLPRMSYLFAFVTAYVRVLSLYAPAMPIA